MKLYLLIILSLLFSNSVFSCQFTKDQFFGSYIYKSGDTAYEDFELSKNGEFHSWLHQRPETSGTWSFDDCKIVINDGSPSNEIMNIISISKSKLVANFNAVINQDKNSKNAVFKRTK